MDPAAERRSKVRICVGDEVTVRFRVKQTSYQEVRITNLSAGGCFATIPRLDDHQFRQGTLLEDFSFGIPELAGPPFSARVAYVLGGRGGGRGGLELIGLGLHFELLPPSMGQALAAFVEARV